MTFSRALLAMPLCLAFLAGGGCSSEDGQEQKPTPKKAAAAPILAETLLKAQAKALSTQILCTKTEECPQAVGMLISIGEPEEKGGKYRVSSCTATLISNDTLITNAHCVPPELQNSGASTKGRLWVFFPAIGKKIEKTFVQIASVLEISETTPGQVGKDYAFLRAETPLSRAPLKISASGVSDALDVRMVRVNPQHGTPVPYGFIGMEYCHVIQRTALAPYFDSNTSPVVTFTGCNMRGGNSGSTLINTHNEIWGVASADQLTEVPLKDIEGKTVTKIAPALVPLLPMLTTDKIETLNIATNMACVQIPGEKRELPESCDVDFAQYNDLETNAKSLFKNTNRDEAFEASLEKWAKKRNERLNQFEWRMQKVEPGSPLDAYLQPTGETGSLKETYIPVPSCLKPSTRKTKSANFSLPVFSLSFALNEYLQISTEEVQLKSPPKAALKPAKENAARITISIRSAVEPVFDAVVAPCEK